MPYIVPFTDSLFGACLLSVLLGSGCQSAATNADGALPHEHAAVAGIDLMTRLGGLWIGPATATPLGDLPMLVMDLRAADERTLFARADLDDQNSLRFAMLVETHAGRDVLTFRNGGYFQGVLRDTRAQLMDGDGSRYHFCAVDQGCGYLDATWSLSASDNLLLDVKVRGSQHLRWPAVRRELRALPQPFPADLRSAGPGTAPFPPLPTLQVQITWVTPLASAADVWLLLATSDCSLAGCTPSRSLFATAPVGSSSAALTLTQIHPGDYKAIALLDRNRSFRTTLQPAHGDGISWPLNQPLTVRAEPSQRASLAIAINVP